MRNLPVPVSVRNKGDELICLRAQRFLALAYRMTSAFGYSESREAKDTGAKNVSV
jgi:hypothetical protein